MNYIETASGQYPVTESEIKALFSNTSFPAAFSPPEGYEAVFTVPQPAIDPLTQYAYEGLPILTGKGHYEQQWVTESFDPETAAANEAAALDTARTVKMVDNNAQYEIAIAAMTNEYPATEITTWERQRAEAVAWGEDSASLTPWIDIAASARGLDRNEYLARTLDKAIAFAAASAYLTGKRQGIDDQLRAATSTAQLAAISIDFSLPGA